MDGSLLTNLPSPANATNWDSAYADRMKWDGGNAGLVQATARTSLGLGNAATLNVGTTAGTVAAGDHTHAAATGAAAGIMSAADKTKLDGLGTLSTANVVSGGTGGTITDDSITDADVG